MSKKTAVGYARRSTDMQERSIPDQQAYVEQWANEHGYTIKRWFVDDAISGTSTKDREAFERMIAEAENGGDFGFVLTYDVSRFSRGGTNETGFYIHRLKLVGVEVIFPAEGIPEGDEGELLMGVKSWQAKQFSVKLSRDSIRGLISSIMARHSAPGGSPPFGYDKQHVAADGCVLRTFRYLSDGRKEEYDSTGKLIRVLPAGETIKKAKSDVVRYVPSTPDRIAVIKRIFDTFAAGYGSRHVAARLNDDGIPTPTGKKWNSNEIRKLVVNPAYCGALAWNKRTSGKLNGVGRDGKLRPRKGIYVTRKNDRADWYTVDDVHEPLVPKDLFAEVQRLQENRRRLAGAAKTGQRALLSGLIVCKRCGWRFGQWHTTTYSRRRDMQVKHRYYVDRLNHIAGKSACIGSRIPADALDAWVIAHVKRALLGDCGTVNAAIDIFVKQALAGQDKPSDTAAVEKELDAVAKRIKAMVGMLADPAFDGLDELKTTLATLKAKRDGLQKALEGSKKANLTLDETQLREWAGERLVQLDKLLSNQATIIEARNLVHSVVDRIDIYPDTRRGEMFIVPDMAGFFLRSLHTLGTLPPPE